MVVVGDDDVAVSVFDALDAVVGVVGIRRGGAGDRPGDGQQIVRARSVLEFPGFNEETLHPAFRAVKPLIRGQGPSQVLEVLFDPVLAIRQYAS